MQLAACENANAWKAQCTLPACLKGDRAKNAGLNAPVATEANFLCAEQASAVTLPFVLEDWYLFLLAQQPLLSLAFQQTYTGCHSN